MGQKYCLKKYFLYFIIFVRDIKQIKKKFLNKNKK